MHSRHDLQRYRLPALCLGLVCLAVAAAHAAWQLQTAAAQRLHAASQQEQQLAARLEQARTAQQQSESLRARLAVLINQGFFNPPEPLQRLEWLQQAGAELGLPALDPGFGPSSRNRAAGPLSLQITPLHLQLSLNHEMELAHLLERLGRGGQLLLPPRECTLERAPARPEPPQPGANIRVDCQLDWISGSRLQPLSGSATGKASAP